MSNDEGTSALIDIWRKLTVDPRQAWVLFRHGTCVTVDPGQPNIREKAVELMETWGRVVPGTDSGDFDVFKVESAPGWIVTFHHPAIRTYVGPDDISAVNPNDVFVGLTGRLKRDLDARELGIIHIQTLDS